MGQQDAPISVQSLAILRLIAAGRSYDQILLRYPELGYQDIFDAAQEALTTLERAHEEGAPPTAPAPLASPVHPSEPAVQRSSEPPSLPEAVSPSEPLADRPSASSENAPPPHRRAWARWTPEEDVLLERLYRRGAHLAEIGQALGRHHGAIKARLTRLGFDADAYQDELLPSDALLPGDARPPRDTVPPGDAPPHDSTPPAPRSGFGWEAIRRRLEGRSEAD